MYFYSISTVCLQSLFTISSVFYINKCTDSRLENSTIYWEYILNFLKINQYTSKSRHWLHEARQCYNARHFLLILCFVHSCLCPILSRSSWICCLIHEMVDVFTRNSWYVRNSWCMHKCKKLLDKAYWMKNSVKRKRRRLKSWRVLRVNNCAHIEVYQLMQTIFNMYS